MQVQQTQKSIHTTEYVVCSIINILYTVLLLLSPISINNRYYIL